MYCSTLAAPIKRRVDEGKTLDTIGKEMCPDVVKPRAKIVKIIKTLLGEQYLIDHAKTLEFDVTRMESGKRGGKTEKDSSLCGKVKTLTLKETLMVLIKEHGYITVENALKEILERQQ